MQNILVLNEGLPKTYHDQCYGNVKVFITLVANDWNPHYIPYAQNELVMTIHEGELPTSSTHIKVPMQPSDDPCKIFELATTQSSNCDIAVDKAI